MRWVRLTARGASRVAVANSELMGPRSLVDELVTAAVTRDPDSPRARLFDYAAATRVTDILRERLGDEASLVFPFYPVRGTGISSTPPGSRSSPWPQRSPIR